MILDHDWRGLETLPLSHSCLMWQQRPTLSELLSDIKLVRCPRPLAETRFLSKCTRDVIVAFRILTNFTSNATRLLSWGRNKVIAILHTSLSAYPRFAVRIAQINKMVSGTAGSCSADLQIASAFLRPCAMQYGSGTPRAPGYQ